MTALSRPPSFELDRLLRRVSSERRALVLHHVTDLFVEAARSCSARQIALFDAIMESLVLNIEPKALAELSCKLATMDTAPVNIIHRLSHDDDIAVAGVILEKSNVLQDDDLIQIAKAKSQYHLLAIAGRAQIAMGVSDVLVDRGNVAVMRRIAANDGASLSDVSFCKLVTTANRDQVLAETVAIRQDLPPELRPFLNNMTGEKPVAPKKAVASK